MEDQFLRYGDALMLFSKLYNGYVQTSGFTDQRVFLQPLQHENAEIFTENQRQFLFRVVPKLSYASIQEYHKSLKMQSIRTRQQEKVNSKYNSSEQKSGFQFNNEMGLLFQEEDMIVQQNRQRAEAEKETNEKLIENCQGQNVLYGQDVQFQHVISEQFLAATNQVADVGKTCYKLKIKEQSNSSFVFMIKPRYKYRHEGDKIMYGDQIVIFSNKTQLHLNIEETAYPLETEYLPSLDRMVHPSLYMHLHEVNLSLSPCSFQIVNYESSFNNSQQWFYKGCVVRLQHTEQSGFISSDGIDYTGDKNPEVLRRTYINEDKQEELDAYSLFIIEPDVKNWDKKQNKGQVLS